MGEGVVGVRLKLVAAQAVARHQTVHDDAGRRKRRQRSRIGAVAHHDCHQEQRDADAACRGHRHRRDDRRGRDVARTHRCQHRPPAGRT